jgi:ABC-type phosphate transport system substrate-binding protein
MKKIILILFFVSIWTAGAFGQVAVIANPSVPVDTITNNELLDFYTRDIRFWNNKKSVTVFDLKPRNEIKEIFYDYLGKSTSRMKSIWMKKMLSGEGDPPESLDSEEDILKKVSSTPGSIGFVTHSLVNKNVKVLAIIESKKN